MVPQVLELIGDLSSQLPRSCFLQVPVVVVIVAQMKSVAVAPRVARLYVIDSAIEIVGYCSNFVVYFGSFGCACRLFGLVLWSMGLLSRIHPNQFVIESLG
jgi:hypothetical protein